MTTMTFTDLPLRARSRSKGMIRSAFERILETRDRHARRHAASSLSTLAGTDRFDLSELERRSLFDIASPERR